MVNSTSPEVTVIICSYNTKDITLKCLDNLKRSIDYSKKEVETIVVENGSDGTGSIIKSKYPWVKLLEPKENTGFAKGNNLGIKASNKNSKYYLLLNSDVLVNNNTLQKSIDFIENNKDCDVLGCRLMLGDGSMQPSGGFLPTPLSVFTWIFGIDLIPVISQLLPQFHPKHKSFFKTSKQVGWVMGAYLFLKNEVVGKTKGFDENFFMYTEEVELCRRINDLGYKIWYTPDFEVTHLDKASSKIDPERLRRIAKNEIVGVVYFLKKYYPNSVSIILLFIKLGLIARVVGFFLFGNKNRMTTYLETLREI